MRFDEGFAFLFAVHGNALISSRLRTGVRHSVLLGPCVAMFRSGWLAGSFPVNRSSATSARAQPPTAPWFRGMRSTSSWSASWLPGPEEPPRPRAVFVHRLPRRGFLRPTQDRVTILSGRSTMGFTAKTWQKPDQAF